MKESKSDIELKIRLGNDLLFETGKLVLMTFVLLFVSVISSLATCLLVWHLFAGADPDFADFFMVSGCIVLSFLTWEMSMPAFKRFPKLMRERKLIKQALFALKDDISSID